MENMAQKRIKNKNKIIIIINIVEKIFKNVYY
jgi:hypothetical protein